MTYLKPRRARAGGGWGSETGCVCLSSVLKAIELGVLAYCYMHGCFYTKEYSAVKSDRHSEKAP